MPLFATWVVRCRGRFFFKLGGILDIVHGVIPFESCVRVNLLRKALRGADLLMRTFDEILRLVVFFLRWHKLSLQVGLGGSPGVSRGGRGGRERDLSVAKSAGSQNRTRTLRAVEYTVQQCKCNRRNEGPLWPKAERRLSKEHNAKAIRQECVDYWSFLRYR